MRRLHDAFLRMTHENPEGIALEVGGVMHTYVSLFEHAASLAATLQAQAPDAGFVAVLGDRSESAYVGILGALLAGKTYTPLNPAYPVSRNAHVCSSTAAAVLVTSEASLPIASEIREVAGQEMALLVPDRDTSEVSKRVFGLDHFQAASAWSDSADGFEPYAYVIFTSGSTGAPKGVPTRHQAAVAMIEAILDLAPLGPQDRCSQCYELSFDGSVMDMFLAWSAGAALCVPSRKALISPGRFIIDSRLTWWASAPSIGAFMRKMGGLKPGRYPDLRWSGFGGEALPLELARTWQAAAPNSGILNLYGPTEAAVVTFIHRFDPETDISCEHGVVPIGIPNEGTGYLVLDENLEEVPAGEKGELYIHGVQLSDGYWKDPEKTQGAFGDFLGTGVRYYRTGDIVRRPMDTTRPVSYLGRSDFQIQLRGHRVELGEVEAVARKLGSLRAAVALPWPLRQDGTADGIFLFVEADSLDVKAFRADLATALPEYMVPREIRRMDALPVTAHGKYDRLVLAQTMEEPDAGSR